MKSPIKRFAALSIIAVATAISQVTIQGAGSADAKMPTVKIGQNVITVEVAQTPAEIQRGLMFRTSLPEDQGMIFLFHPSQVVNFWMYHCYISLDMLFIKDGKIVHIFENVPPCKAEDPHQCPTYPEGNGMEVTEVVEVNGGYAKRHGVKVGEAVSFEMQK